MFCISRVLWNGKKTVRLIREQLQSPLGFATLDKAAARDLVTATPSTDLRQYINSDFGFSDLEIWFLYSKKRP